MLKKLKNYTSRHTGILIRFDDIAENMNWNLMEKCENLFLKYSIKPVLGVIPKNQDKELQAYPTNNKFWDRVRGWKNLGWEIVMHGYTHVYDSTSYKKKDFFSYGGGSEFYGHSFEKQKQRLAAGLKKFEEEKIQIRSFFAPNHIYDENTFLALKSLGIKQVIDGYGLFPYLENDITFIPQLFYENRILPFGLQSTQIHLNYWSDKDFLKFENFVSKNHNKIINYDQMLHRVNNTSISYISRFFTSRLLKLKRIMNNR
ncbi:DUF2334 domain-containing protein [Pelagibacteraceae bacterium]|nr:DUF2334 domain-containing protein [Pelagibacteraceae bacterium]